MTAARDYQEQVFDQFASYVDFNHLDKADQLLTEMEKNSFIKPSTIKKCAEYLQDAESQVDQYVEYCQTNVLY